ncbi:MAG: dTDP-4-dehydrorhamnose reductase [Deltaproteobacteria bacterium]|nr:dTDP-4-dehydrorhamnose reductase [Deltaproteobacteria bacterium]
MGASGLLGATLARTFAAQGAELFTPSHQQADVVDLAALDRFVEQAQPDVLINCAAEAHVDIAETDTDRVFRVNALGPQNAAVVAAKHRCELVQISSDYVFDGETDRPYREYDPTGTPASQYGRSKLLAEQLVREACQRHYILRVAALFGHGRQTFVDWVLAKASPQQPLRIVCDRQISPTWTNDIAEQTVAMLELGVHGTYHCSGDGVTTWYEFASAALALAGKNAAGVVAVPDAELQLGGAPRPRYSALDNYLFKLREIDRVKHWRDGLAHYLRAIV